MDTSFNVEYGSFIRVPSGGVIPFSCAKATFFVSVGNRLNAGQRVTIP